jgi:putative endopeptidase
VSSLPAYALSGQSVTVALMAEAATKRYKFTILAKPDATNFKQRTDCEVNEYGNFTAVDDLKINGKLTLGENTADNGGLRLAYRAFLEDAARQGIDVNKKGADGYTPLQQFFLAYGQNWCGSTRPEQLRMQVQTNPHSPLDARANGVVQNMPEFGQVFGCNVGQPMMPVNACRVW